MIICSWGHFLGGIFGPNRLFPHFAPFFNPSIPQQRFIIFEVDPRCEQRIKWNVNFGNQKSFPKSIYSPPSSQLPIPPFRPWIDRPAGWSGAFPIVGIGHFTKSAPVPFSYQKAIIHPKCPIPSFQPFFPIFRATQNWEGRPIMMIVSIRAQPPKLGFGVRIDLPKMSNGKEEVPPLQIPLHFPFSYQNVHFPLHSLFSLAHSIPLHLILLPIFPFL